MTSWNTTKSHHFQIQSFLQPQLIHDLYHLDGQHVLLKIISNLFMHLDIVSTYNSTAYLKYRWYQSTTFLGAEEVQFQW